MKTIHIATLIAFVCLLSACQGSPATALPTPDQRLLTQEVRATPTFTIVPTRIPSTSTPAPQKIQATATIEQTIPVTQTPIIDLIATLETGKIVDSDNRFTGNLYVGSSGYGVYFQFDFEQDRISKIQLPENCQLLETGKEAICRDNAHVGDLYYDTYSLYDISATGKQHPFTNDDGKWILSSSGDLIESADVTGEIMTIKAYDLVTKEVFQIGTFEHHDHQFLIPYLSNSGEQMIGVDYATDPYWLDDHWYFMEKASMTPEPILMPESLFATRDSIAWAPNDSRAVLIGGHDDIGPHSGDLICGKEILLFDPETQAVESIGRAPSGRCITEFFIFPHQVWSPDSSKLALVLDQQDICIMDLSKKEAPCQVITNNIGSDRYVKAVTWSVDSQWLAYMMMDTRLQVYSIQEARTYTIADFKGVSSDDRSIGLNMVWGK